MNNVYVVTTMKDLLGDTARCEAGVFADLDSANKAAKKDMEEYKSWFTASSFDELTEEFCNGCYYGHAEAEGNVFEVTVCEKEIQ